MNFLLLGISLLLSLVAGVCFLVGYLWYHHAHKLHEETLFPDDSTGVMLLRYGVTAGFFMFGGFLLSSILWLLAASTVGTGSPAETSAFVALPFRRVSVGLFLLALSMFIVAGSSYAADAVRNRFTGVR